MKKQYRQIIRYTTKIIDMLYYLLPLELFLGLLWGLSISSIWFITRVRTIISWEAWWQIRDVFQMLEVMLLQEIIIVIIIYLSTHIFLCYIWIKEDKFLNFFRTLNDTHKLRKGMRLIGKKEVKVLHNQYNRAIRSAHCLITTDNIILKVRKTDIEEIDTNLKEKFKFSSRSVCQKYSKQYVFSDIIDPFKYFIIQGSKSS